MRTSIGQNKGKIRRAKKSIKTNVNKKFFQLLAILPFTQNPGQNTYFHHSNTPLS
jgi:hypothetical protein